jgi:hypothetical protein
MKKLGWLLTLWSLWTLFLALGFLYVMFAL